MVAYFTGGFTYLSADGEPVEEPDPEPPGNGGQTGEEEQEPEAPEEPSEEPEEQYDITQWTWGPVEELPGGLGAVALGSSHPGYGLHDAMWPPACTANCAAMLGRS